MLVITLASTSVISVLEIVKVENAVFLENTALENLFGNRNITFVYDIRQRFLILVITVDV